MLYEVMTMNQTVASLTFAAGVYTSIFGSAKQPINSHYSRQMFARVKANSYNFV